MVRHIRFREEQRVVERVVFQQTAGSLGGAFDSKWNSEEFLGTNIKNYLGW